VKRREFLSLAAAAAGYGTAPSAQERRVYRLGLLVATSSSMHAPLVAALRSGLREIGYLEPTNIVIETRYAEGKYERLPELAEELVSLGPDVLVTHGTPGTRAAQRATRTIPIVMAVSGDAVGTGLIASLARPGGNVTGTTFFDPELEAKRLELLVAALPRPRRVAVLNYFGNPANRPTTASIAATALSLGVEIKIFEAASVAAFEEVFSEIANSASDCVVITTDAIFATNGPALAGLAAGIRLPSAGPVEFAQAGGLLGFGVDLRELWHRAAYFVDRILQGAKPGDIPVEQPTKFDLIINLKTAKALGLDIPPSLLARADEVIE
jgi:putative ABC transport system substrate-binding protein